MRAECYAFTGAPLDVADRLYQLPQDVVTRVCYALLLEGDGRAGIHVFLRERPGDTEGTVMIWEGTTLDETPEQVVGLVLRHQPEPPLADRVLTFLKAHRDLADVGRVPCPPTPRGAFGHPVRHYSGSTTLRTVVVAL
jgi:hypothetical protein